MRKTPEVFFKNGLSYLTQLEQCTHAIPFIFRFYPPNGVTPVKGYEQMVHESLLVLFGWLLPEQLPDSPNPIDVKVVCEAFDAQHCGGAEQTELIRGILMQAARRDSQRFARWKLSEVRWIQKLERLPSSFSKQEILEQGYLGYGDLLGYLALGNELKLARKLSRQVQLEKWANYLTLSVGLANELEILHQTGLTDPGGFLDRMSANLDSPFMLRIMDSLRQRWRTDAALRNRLFAELDSQYLNKLRDLRSLSRQFGVIQRVIGPLPPDAPRRLRLIELCLHLQRANHFGNPADLGELERSYANLRRKALDNGEADLVAHVDLNLAVAASDRFEPKQALIIVDQLLEEEARISLLSRAKASSARGQYLSMVGNFVAARDEFNKALDFIREADLTEDEREAEWDQTAIYRAFNAIDAGFPEAREQVEEVIRKGGMGSTLRHQFRHHLWLRLLFSEPSLAEERHAYLDQISDDMLDQHPWQLIAMYRGLFAAELDLTEDAVRWFNRSLEIALGSMHGATLRTIAAVVATVAWQETGEAAFKEAAIGIINGGWEDGVPNLHLTEALPTTAFIVEELEKTLHMDKPCFRSEEILGLLRFNYR